MLVDEMPEMGSLGPKALKGTPVTMHLVVADVDSFTARAVAAGANVVMPVADMFWGDRYGVLVDPFGHRWSVATHIRDMTPDEIREALANLPPMDGPDCAELSGAEPAAAKAGSDPKAQG